MHISHAQVSKLLALGALGVSAVVFLLWVLLVFNTRPYPNGTTDTTNAFLVWFSTGGVAAGIILAHLYLARWLWRDSHGERRPVRDPRH